MTRIHSITNQKGGVGKTTTAINLAASLAALGRRVLLVDMDPQSNASSGLGIRGTSAGQSIYQALVSDDQDPNQLVVSTEMRNLSVIPASRDLAAAEIELVSVPRREYRLRAALDRLGASHDNILLDCPPSLGLLTLNTLTAADSVMIPIQCEFYALEGLSQLLNTVRLVQRALNPTLEIEGVLLTMYDSRLKLSKQVASEAREYFGDRVYETLIPRNVRLAEAPSFGKPILQYDVLSTGAQCYLNLAREMVAGRGGAPPGNTSTVEVTGA